MVGVTLPDGRVMKEIDEEGSIEMDKIKEKDIK